MAWAWMEYLRSIRRAVEGCLLGYSEELKKGEQEHTLVLSSIHPRQSILKLPGLDPVPHPGLHQGSDLCLRKVGQNKEKIIKLDDSEPNFALKETGTGIEVL